MKGTADGIENLSNRAAEGVKGTLGETVRASLFTPGRASMRAPLHPSDWKGWMGCRQQAS